jgi:hypothetical protein
MTHEQGRAEELRVDGQQIKAKLHEVLQPHQTETRQFHVSGDQLVDKVKEIVHAGNVRRVTIRRAGGDTRLDIPLTLGLAGALLLPVWAALGAIAALALNYTIAVEKDVD